MILISCKDTEENKEVQEQTTVQPLPFFNSADFTPEWIETSSPEYPDIHTIDTFQLLNQNGETVANETFKDKIYVADFFFTSCGGICPKLTKHMKKIQDHFIDADDVLLISHTVMPSIDSVETLKNYANKFGAIDNKWHFVTGEQSKIYDLARNSYFADEDFTKTKDESAFVHTENFLLIDQLGRIRGVYNGTIELEVNRLIEHIERLR
jgi:protein SCO1/2